MKSKVQLNSTFDIPAFKATSRHQYLAHLYAPTKAGTLEVDAIKRKESYLHKAETRIALEPLVNSPPKIDFKSYKHGSGLWPSPAIGNKALKSPPEVEDHWWEKAPTLPGEACLDVHNRLCDPNHFTGQYKHKFLQKEEPIGIAGDYYEKPIAAIRLLKNKTYSELTVPKRAADFKAEVTWRLQLRPLEV